MTKPEEILKYGFFEIDTTKGLKFLSSFPTTKETYEKLTQDYAGQNIPDGNPKYIVARFIGEIDSPKIRSNDGGGLTKITKDIFDFYKCVRTMPEKPTEKTDIENKDQKYRAFLKELGL